MEHDGFAPGSPEEPRPPSGSSAFDEKRAYDAWIKEVINLGICEARRVGVRAIEDCGNAFAVGIHNCPKARRQSRGWLKKCANRFARRWREREQRIRAREQPYLSDEDLERLQMKHAESYFSPSAEDVVFRNEDIALYLRALDDLTPEQREAYVRHVVNGEDLKSIAISQNTSVSVIGQRVLRAQPTDRTVYQAT